MPKDYAAADAPSVSAELTAKSHTATSASIQHLMYLLSSDSEHCKAWFAGIRWFVINQKSPLFAGDLATGLSAMTFFARILGAAAQESNSMAEHVTPQSLQMAGLIPGYIKRAAAVVRIWHGCIVSDSWSVHGKSSALHCTSLHESVTPCCFLLSHGYAAKHYTLHERTAKSIW